MLSLRRTGRFKSEQIQGSAVDPVSGVRRGRVLPRPMRLVTRRFTRYLETRPPKPFGPGAAVVAAFFVVTAGYASYLNGSTDELIASTSTSLGLHVKSIEISGQKETRERDIVQRVGLTRENAIMGLDVADARQRILDLPWVSSAEVRKIYPGRLAVKVSERSPFAIWQRDGELFVIEKSGKIIEPYTDSRFNALPLVVGSNAGKVAIDFLRDALEYPQIFNQTEAFVYVSERRWDLRLKNGVTVKLPEKGYKSALSLISDMDGKNDLLSRDIRSVDLRLADRVVVRLNQEAADKRRIAVEKRLKAHLKAEKAT